MNEWMNECLNEWMVEWLNEWMNEWVIDWLIDWMNEWTTEWTNEQTNEHVINLLFLFSVCALFACAFLHVVGGQSGKVFFGICEFVLLQHWAQILSH